MRTPLEWFTLALVLITAYYAWQTRKTVEEMRKAREAALRPRLVPVFRPGLDLGPGRGRLFVMNLGEGTALNIEVALALQPNETPVPIVWRGPMLKGGGEREVNNPLGPAETVLTFGPRESSDRTHVSLRGHCFDILGHRLEVNETTIMRDDWQPDLTAVATEGE